MNIVNIEFDKEKFVLTLKELINAKSILAFSKIVGIPQRTISSWINKKTAPCIDHLIRLALYFDCSIDYLVGLKDY